MKSTLLSADVFHLNQTWREFVYWRTAIHLAEAAQSGSPRGLEPLGIITLLGLMYTAVDFGARAFKPLGSGRREAAMPGRVCTEAQKSSAKRKRAENPEATQRVSKKWRPLGAIYNPDKAKKANSEAQKAAAKRERAENPEATQRASGKLRGNYPVKGKKANYDNNGEVSIRTWRIALCGYVYASCFGGTRCSRS